MKVTESSLIANEMGSYPKARVLGETSMNIVPTGKNKLSSRKRAASNIDEPSTPMHKRAKQDKTPAVISPTNNDEQPIERGKHMEQKKVAINNDEISPSSKKKKRDRRRTGVSIPNNPLRALTNTYPSQSDKHAPYYGPGKTFLWKDNPGVSKRKAKLNETDPSLLKIKLTDSTGKVWRSAKFVRHTSMDFSDPKMTKDLNKWRSQFLSRTLDKNSTVPKSSRPRWSSGEMLYMSLLIKKAIWKKRASLSGSDWVVIAKQMNERFENTTARKGEQIPNTLNAKKVLVKGDVLKKDHRIPKRSYNTMKNQAGRWPGVVTMIADTLAEASSSSDEDIPAYSTAQRPNKGKGIETDTQHQLDADMSDGTVGVLGLDSESEDEDDAESQGDEGEGEDMDIDQDLKGDSDAGRSDQRAAGKASGSVLVAA